MDLAIVGAVVVGFWLLKFVLGLFSKLFKRSAINLNKYKGQWAVVTGSSFGIGEGFARVLAAKGINVVMIARSMDKLTQIADDIKKQKIPTGQTKCIKFDFENADDAAWSQLTSELIALEPVILVNNVGVSTDIPLFFQDAEAGAKMHSMITVNIESHNRITYALLPGMIQRKTGAILFLSSGSALVPTPLLSVYAATKAYNNHFALSLNEELKGTGVWAQSYTPFFIASQMTKMRANFFVPASLSWARQAVALIGKEARSNPYWLHSFLANFLTALPDWLRRRQVWNSQFGLYKRSLKKREREAAKKQ